MPPPDKPIRPEPCPCKQTRDLTSYHISKGTGLWAGGLESADSSKGHKARAKMCALCPSRGFRASPPPPTPRPQHQQVPRSPTLLRFRTRKKSLAFCWETWSPSSAVTQLSHARQSLRNILASANL